MVTSPAVFTRILVAVDGSDHGRHAARVAAGLARALGARLTLLTLLRRAVRGARRAEPFPSAQ
jgi:nucleotide-binding universal stress UspA family protein